LRRNAAGPLPVALCQKLLRLDQFEMGVQFMTEIDPPLDVEWGRKTLLSRIKQARKFTESRKPQKPIDRNDIDCRHRQSW